MALETGEPEQPKGRRLGGRRGNPKMPQVADEPTRGYGPSVPTCGNDLIGLWDLPQEAITQARLKITREVPMSNRQELVGECTVQDYSMEWVAHKYGKGSYEIILNPGPGGMWPGKRAKILVSEAYARECGFTPFEVVTVPPAPRISELRSMKETAQVMQQGGAMTPEVLAQLLETAITRTAERLRPPTPPPDPMASLTPMFQMMTFIQTMQKGAVDQALALAGMRAKLEAPEPGDDDDISWPGLFKAALPTLGQIGQALASRVAPAPVQEIAPEPIQPKEQPVEVPMTQAEIERFAAAVALLKPYAKMIVTIVTKSKNGADAAADLASFIPDRLAPDVVAYAQLAAERGPAVLALLDPGLTTEKGLACIVEIGRILSE